MERTGAAHVQLVGVAPGADHAEMEQKLLHLVEIGHPVIGGDYVLNLDHENPPAGHASFRIAHRKPADPRPVNGHFRDLGKFCAHSGGDTFHARALLSAF